MESGYSKKCTVIFLGSNKVSFHLCSDSHNGSTWIHQGTECKAARKECRCRGLQINVVKRTLPSARGGVGQFHRRVYRSAVELAKVVNVDESVPRTTGRQQHRCNVPYASVSEYFQRQLTICALDYLISEINPLRTVVTYMRQGNKLYYHAQTN